MHQNHILFETVFLEFWSVFRGGSAAGGAPWRSGFELSTAACDILGMSKCLQVQKASLHSQVMRPQKLLPLHNDQQDCCHDEPGVDELQEVTGTVGEQRT